MTIVLRNQLEASERAAEELGNKLLLQHHRPALLSYDVRDPLRHVIELHSEFNRHVERWQDARAAAGPGGPGEYDQLAATSEDLFRRLGALFEKTVGLVGAVEGLGFAVDGKQEFLAAWRELRATLSFSVDRVAAAAEQVRRGETRPLAEVMRELWDSPVR